MAHINEPNFDNMPFGVAQIVSLWIESNDDGTRAVIARGVNDHAAVASGLSYTEAVAMKSRIWELVRMARRLIHGTQLR